MGAEPGYILDSSALIALLAAEPGAPAVASALGSAAICSVNMGEVLTKLIRRGGEPKVVERLLRGLDLEVVPWTAELVWQGWDLCPLAWTHGFSLADRACLTLARALGQTALTSDVAWAAVGAALDPPVRVRLFRSPRPQR